jgi:hypothetical protein
MGVILDSSVVIVAERRGDTVEQLIEKIVTAMGDQEGGALCHRSDRTDPRHLSRSSLGDTPAPRIVHQRTAG